MSEGRRWDARRHTWAHAEAPADFYHKGINPDEYWERSRKFDESVKANTETLKQCRDDYLRALRPDQYVRGLSPDILLARVDRGQQRLRTPLESATVVAIVRRGEVRAGDELKLPIVRFSQGATLSDMLEVLGSDEFAEYNTITDWDRMEAPDEPDTRARGYKSRFYIINEEIVAKFGVGDELWCRGLLFYGSHPRYLMRA